MAVSRNVWNAQISKDRWPAGCHCPTCSGGYLHLLPDTFHFDEAASSRHAHGEVWCEPDHVENRFCGMLRCSNRDCEEVVVVVGTGNVLHITSADLPDDSWVEQFVPVFVHPPARFIELAEAIPFEI